MSTKFVDEKNARPGQYGQVISDIAQKGVCPFCPEQIHNFHKKPIEERVHWLVTENMYPYPATKHHVMLVHKVHIEHIADISPEAWGELHEIIRDEIKKRAITGGSFVCRFGDTHFTGASVTHLHAHIVQSNPEDPAYDKQKGLQVRLG